MIDTQALTDEELGEELFRAREELERARSNVWRFESEIKRRLDDRGQEALPHTHLDIRRERTYEYIPDLVLAGVAEHIDALELRALVTERHIEEVPASVNGHVARSLSSKYKGNVAEALLQARRLVKERVTVKERKEHRK